MHNLWYDREASCWNEALPLGNGRIGAMVFGGAKKERIQLNEESVWSGGPRDRVNPTAFKSVEKVRRLIRAGEITKAQQLARLALNGTPIAQRVYQTAGVLELDFDGMENISAYRRVLDIETAVSTVSFTADGAAYTRTMFISKPDNVAVLRIYCSEKGRLSFTAKLDRGIYIDNQFTAAPGTIAIERTEDIAFCTMAKAVVTGGESTEYGGVLRVDNADEAIIYINIETAFRHEDYRSRCIEVLNKASERTFFELFHAHVDDYSELFSRLSLDLGGDDLSNVPTDVRLQGFGRGNDDNGLVELYYQFGRYLMIASSRQGTLPTTLQGIWNEFIDPPWGCKYTININTQMNYWPSNMCALHELQLPLFEHLKRMLPKGRAVAKAMYGVDGFMCHHNTDIWGDCAPQDDWLPATHWVLGAAWLCTHIWEHYEYTLDRDFLIEYYPILREACQFFVGYLREDDRGRLVIIPTMSPENSYRHPSGDIGCLSEGCTMDNQILRQLFGGCIAAEKELGITDGLSGILSEMSARLPETTIHSNGTILEWNEEYEEIEIGHRHISHLYGLFPSSEINIEHTPKLAAAARATLERRLSHGGGHTGWSMAWIINLWARLHDADKCWEGVRRLLTNSTLPNLFDNHPPFQIDGNFGALAGITQMIVQSIDDEIILLPALPSDWKKGSIKGVALRGSLTADIHWDNGVVTALTIAADRARSVTVRVNGKNCKVELCAGDNVII